MMGRGEHGFEGERVAQNGAEVITVVAGLFQAAGDAIGELQFHAGQFLVGQEADFQLASFQGADLAREAVLSDDWQLAVGGRFDLELDFRQRGALENGDVIYRGPAVPGTGAVVKGGADCVGGVGEFGRGGGGLLGRLFQNHDFIAAGRRVKEEFGGIGGFSRGGEFQGDVFALCDGQVAGLGLDTGERDVGARLEEPLGENPGPGKINGEEDGQHDRRRGEAFCGADQAAS